MHVAFFVLISFIILLLVSGGYVFVVGCVRRKELPWLVEDEIKKTSYKKYYDYIVLSNKTPSICQPSLSFFETYHKTY